MRVDWSNGGDGRCTRPYGVREGNCLPAPINLSSLSSSSLILSAIPTRFIWCGQLVAWLQTFCYPIWLRILRLFLLLYPWNRILFCYKSKVGQNVRGTLYLTSPRLLYRSPSPVTWPIHAKSVLRSPLVAICLSYLGKVGNMDSSSSNVFGSPMCHLYHVWVHFLSLSLRYYLSLLLNMTLVFPKFSMSTVPCPNRRVYLLGKQTSVWQWSISIYVLVPVDSGMDGEVRWFGNNNLSPMSCVES